MSAAAVDQANFARFAAGSGHGGPFFVQNDVLDLADLSSLSL